MKQRILRYWAYFRRGHSLYLIFLISFLQFIVIQYRLLVEYIPLLKTVFSHMLYFAAAFIFTYGFAATVLGWLDYKRGSVITDSILAAKFSPYAADAAEASVLSNKALIHYMNGDKEEAEREMKKAIDVMKKWCRDAE